MKKILSILLTTVMLLGVFIIPAQAVDEAETETEYYCKDRFCECYPNYFSDTLDHNYSELCVHHSSETGDVDWVLVYTTSDEKYRNALEGIAIWWEEIGGFEFLLTDLWDTPFCIGYGFYAVDEDKFFDIFAHDGPGQPTMKKYEGLEDEYTRQFLLRNCQPCDVNHDGTTNISDVTGVQKNVAKLDEFNQAQSILADLDSDGKITIIDVTLTQKYIAGLYQPVDYYSIYKIDDIIPAGVDSGIDQVQTHIVDPSGNLFNNNQKRKNDLRKKYYQLF